MSLEQPQEENNQPVLKTNDEEAESYVPKILSYDSKGNPRTLRTIPETGVVAALSQEEYEEAISEQK